MDVGKNENIKEVNIFTPHPPLTVQSCTAPNPSIVPNMDVNTLPPFLTLSLAFSLISFTRQLLDIAKNII